MLQGKEAVPKPPGILWANKSGKRGVSITQTTEGKCASLYNRGFSVKVKIRWFSKAGTASAQLCSG